MPTRVVVVDDQTVFREMLVEILDADPNYEVVGQFGLGKEAVAALRKERADVLVLDAVLPDMSGIDVLKALAPQLKHLSVLLVTAHDKAPLIQSALEAGAHGIVMKGVPLKELREAIARVAAKGSYLCATSSGLLRQHAMGQKQTVALSPRERQILQLVASGLSSKEIATQLGLSEKTVANHRMHIRDKLGLRDVASFTRYAIEHGLIEPRS